MKQLDILLSTKGTRMLLLSFLLALLPSSVNAMATEIVGNIKKMTVDGIEWTYTVLNEEEKSCEIGGVELDEHGEEIGIAAISKSTTGKVTIPSMLDEYTVVGICNSAFRKIPISEVIIPAGVKSIGEKAFMQCGSLMSVILPEGLTFIGEEAFSESAISNITLPESLVRIGEQAFEQTQLNTIDLPVNVKYLGNEDRVSETGDVIEENDLYGDVFNGCASLTALNVAEGNTAYASVDGMLLTKDKKTLLFSPIACQATVVPQGVECIYESAFYKSLLTSITLPSSLNEIGGRAFYGCDNLNEVVSYIKEPFEISEGTFGYEPSATLYVPSGTKEKYETTPSWNQFQNIVEMESTDRNIEFADTVVKAICVEKWDTNGDGELNYDEAAAVTDLGNAFINNSEITSFDELQYFTEMTNIGSQAFKGCTQLKNIAIPTSVTSIDEQAFYECTELSSINLPLGLTNIGSLAFGNCISLINITIPEGVRCIGGAAFFACRSLTSVTIPTSVTDIGANPFQFCDKLSTILVEEENPVYDSRESCNAIILTREDKIISGCMDSVIPNTVRTIGQVAFWGSGLAAISIPNSVTTVESNSFRYNFNLTSVTIPNSVTSIGYNAFFGCTGLVTVTSLIEEPFEIFSDVFTYWNFETDAEEFTTATLYVPVGTKEKYMATPAWNQFQNIVEMGLDPVDQGETIDFGNEIDENTDLNGTVVDNVLVNISNENGGYDPVEGCIVVNTPTDDSSINGQDIFGDDFKENYTGIVFKVAPGSGSIKVEAQTTGNMVLKVKIGEGMPITMELEGKLKVTFPYSVTEETNVYIYGGMNTAGAKPFGIKGANSSDSSLKIYSIEVDSNSTGIDGVDAEDDSSADAPVYNLNGQRVNNVGKGIYIKNGRKVLVK